MPIQDEFGILQPLEWDVIRPLWETPDFESLAQTHADDLDGEHRSIASAQDTIAEIEAPDIEAEFEQTAGLAREEISDLEDETINANVGELLARAEDEDPELGDVESELPEEGRKPQFPNIDVDNPGPAPGPPERPPVDGGPITY